MGEIRSLEQKQQDPDRRRATLSRLITAIDLVDLLELAVGLIDRLDAERVRTFIESKQEELTEALAAHVDAALLAQATWLARSRKGPDISDGVTFMNVVLDQLPPLTPHSTHFPCCPDIAFDVTEIETIASVDLNLYAVDFTNARERPEAMWDTATLREQLDATPMMVMCPGCSCYVRLLELS